MNEYHLNDPLNLKDLILTFTGFLHDKHPDSQLDTMLYFLNQLFDDSVISLVDFREKRDESARSKSADAVVTDLQKLLSGTPLPKNYTDFLLALREGRLDEALLNNIRPITQAIGQCSGSAAFWSRLQQRISPIFFSREESADLGRHIADGAYELCLLKLLKHSFANLESIPPFAAKHIYEEAQTYDFDSPPRYRLLKLAADLGHERAAQEYGNYAHRMYREHNQPDSLADAFRYTLKALPLPSALWNLAYQLMGQELSREQIDELKRVVKLDKKLKGPEFELCRQELELVHCMVSAPLAQESYELAYQLHFYLAYTGFAKGFNSLYVLLSGAKYGFELTGDDPRFPTKEALADHYLNQASSNSCLFALQNAGLRGYHRLSRDQKPVDDWTLDYTQLLLQTAASYGLERSAVSLGELYLDEPHPDRSQAQEWFQLALSYNQRSVRALYGLGLLSTSPEQKAAYFRRAISAGNREGADIPEQQLAARAALRYAEAKHTLHFLSGDALHLREAADAIRISFRQMSPEDQQTARDFLHQLDTSLVEK